MNILIILSIISIGYLIISFMREFKKKPKQDMIKPTIKTTRINNIKWDISKWNTETAKDKSDMFEKQNIKCDFSKWNIENTPEQEAIAAKWRGYYMDRFNKNYR